MKGLSEREREVLCLAAEGLPSKAIALRLDIAEPTVKNHLARTYRKLGVANRAAAVRCGIERGAIPLAES